jgi:hypothetical protein
MRSYLTLRVCKVVDRTSVVSNFKSHQIHKHRHKAGVKPSVIEVSPHLLQRVRGIDTNSDNLRLSGTLLETWGIILRAGSGYIALFKRFGTRDDPRLELCR